MTKKKKWTLKYGMESFTPRRRIKPTGRLYILGRYLTVEETANYLKAK